jgi:DNA repair exonuclease SbcCD ATPase subunit
MADVVILPKKEEFDNPMPSAPNVRELSDKYYNLEYKIKEIEKLHKKKEQLLKKVKEYIEMEKPVRNNALENEITILSSEIRKLEPIKGYSKCPTCNRPIDKKQVEDTLKSLTAKLEKTKHKLIEADLEYQNQLQQYKKMVEQKKLREEIASIFIDSNIEDLKQQQEEISEKLKKLNEEYTKQLQVYKEKEEVLKEIRKHNAAQDALLAQKTKAEKEYKLKEKELQRLKKEYDDAQLLASVFSENGIIKYKLPERLNLLNTLVNKELHYFTTQFKLHFTLKKNKIQRTLLNNNKEYPVENCSEGEYMRLVLSFLFALRFIIEKVKGISVNLFFFDEIFGSLDAVGRDLLLNRVANISANCFIISHSYYNERYPVLQATKENKISTLTYIPAIEGDEYGSVC